MREIKDIAPYIPPGTMKFPHRYEMESGLNPMFVINNTTISV
jgi:hypothetical protein